ncbi:hypothetical protein L9F63_022663, partial [Diploptera punctata]
EGGTKLEELETALKGKKEEEAKFIAAQKANRDNIVSEEKKLKQLERSLKEEGELKKVEGLFTKLKDTDKSDAEALAAAQKKFQAVSAGLVIDDDGSDKTLQDQLMEVKQEVAQAQTEAKQSQMQLQHCKNELKDKLQEMKQTATSYEKDKRNLENMEKELTNLQNELNRINYEDGYIEKLQDERRRLTSEMRNLKGKMENIEARNPSVNFQYKDPDINFQRSSVHGVVCKLFKMKDPAMSTALEIAAGGRLFNVIVDTEVTAKKLLNKGQLQRRTTIIPLNKIVGHSLDQRTVSLAEQLVGKDNVFPALSLIEYDPVIHPAMQWILGQTFICRDMEAAKKVTFNERILKKSVTLDGDVFDPSGTLSGGSRPRGMPLLNQLEEFHKAQEEFNAQEQRVTKIDHDIKNITKVAERYQQLKQRVELMSHEVELVRRRLQQTTHHQHQEEVDALKAKIVELEEKVKHCNEVVETGNKKAKDLENKVKNSKAIQEQALKNAEKEMNVLKKKAEQSRMQWKQREQEFETLNLEIRELKASIETGQSQIQSAKETIDQLKQQHEQLNKDVEEAKAVVMRLPSLMVIQASVQQLQNDVKLAERDSADCSKKRENCQRERLKQKNANQRLSQTVWPKLLINFNSKKYKNKYGWIKDEKHYFGKPGTMYDFKENNPQEVGKRLSKLQDKSEKLGRNINTRAMNLSARSYEYNDVLRKKKIVEADKAKIMYLLPGAQARLHPPEGMDVLDGLEVKVGFSGIWKESLGELSGGQRSLVALSLILAMLLFKPAPIYILDEVDAALDLSHTQNIGNMLKSHFKKSQFIIVSLKDGMFNNANVLFRTKFVDGMSTVSPITPTENSFSTQGASH